MLECLTARDKTGTGSSSTSQTAEWSRAVLSLSLRRAAFGSFWQLLAAWGGANRHKKLVRLGEKRPGWGTIGKKALQTHAGALANKHSAHLSMSAHRA